LNEKDTQFFEEHWEEWVKRNPPPDNWEETKKQWAALEMPCRGFFGRCLFWLLRKK